MADRGYIPSSPACGQWETLLAEALDGQLRPEDAAMFHEHMTSCPACSSLFEEARRGREWLEFLSPEPEVPEGLLDRILAQTGPGQVAGFGLVTEGAAVAAMPQPWQRPGFTARVRRYAEPRLLMTVAMAFFSIALTLNLTGVKLSNLHVSDLRPSAIKSAMTRRIVTASIPLIRYYDHLRFMYEVESSMRQMRGTSGEGESQQPSQSQPVTPGESKRTTGGKNGGSHVEPPQHNSSPDSGPVSASSEYMETSFTLKDRTSTPAAHTSHRWSRPAHSGGSVRRVGERSMRWIA